MAVARAHHRAGVGTAMLDFTEHHLAKAGVRFLQVKTLGPGREDLEYAKTRAFYQSSGFVELETFPDLWDPVNPALQMIKYLGDR
jgi:GNAT superfamily N-acetyltransferase